MKLNLGCGNDIRNGYVNVDFRSQPNTVNVDLSKLPWPWQDESVDEILMLDFLEHFPYARTQSIIDEVWRIMKMGAEVHIQVPDFEVCANAAIGKFDRKILCHSCGERLQSSSCSKCGKSSIEISEAAIHRIMGGQDYEGNFHFNLFTKETMQSLLEKNGFENISFIERNENNETYEQNWNFRVRATKKDAWQ